MKFTRNKSSMNEYDLELEDENSIDFESAAGKNDRDSDEDTEDASETDMVKQEEEYTEIKEQVYQDKLANLKKQLQQLEQGLHPEYLRKLRKLKQNYEDRQLLNKVIQAYELERVEQEYHNEIKAAVKDFEEKKIELKENLIAELEEKKRLIEAERTNMELTGDSMDVKPVTTRKLRRRPNDPLPVPEKRRKTSPKSIMERKKNEKRTKEKNLATYTQQVQEVMLEFLQNQRLNKEMSTSRNMSHTQLCYLLDESEIMEDLRIINKGRLPSGSKRHESSESLSSCESTGPSLEVRVEDGKLYYDKKWFHRGQPVYFEGKEVGSKNSGVICTISSSEVWIKKTSDCTKIRIYISQLQKGKYTIKRRSS